MGRFAAVILTALVLTACANAAAKKATNTFASYKASLDSAVAQTR